MNNTGDAAEQIVRMSLDGVEVAARITGSAAKEIALLLMAALKNNEKNLKLKGKERLSSMLKSGKPLEIYSLRESDLAKFSQGAKQYGIVYCVLRNTKNNPDGICDIMVRADDAPKISRVIERFKFATVDRAKIENELIAEKAEKAKKSNQLENFEIPELPIKPKYIAENRDDSIDAIPEAQDTDLYDWNFEPEEPNTTELEKLLDELLGITESNVEQTSVKQSTDRTDSAAQSAGNTGKAVQSARETGSVAHSKDESGRAGQTKPAQERSRQIIDKQRNTKQVNAEQRNAKQGKPGQRNTNQLNTEKRSARQVNAYQRNTGQTRAASGYTEQNIAGRERTDNRPFPKSALSAHSQSEHISVNEKSLEKPTLSRKTNISIQSPFAKPSVKEELREIAAAKKLKESDAKKPSERAPEPGKQKNTNQPVTTIHKQPNNTKSKSKKSKGSR